MEYKGYKLKYEVTKLYVEDDDALIELFEVAKKHDLEMIDSQRGAGLNAILAQQQQAWTGGYSALAGQGLLGQLF